MDNNKFRILSLEACDILKAKDNANGYLLPIKKDDRYYSLFKNTLDWSLDSEEIQNAYAKIIRNKFCFVDDLENLYTLAVVNVKFKYTLKDDFDKKIVIKNTSQMREELYRDGFLLEGKKYIRYKRSAGSSRQGRCLFIREELYNHMDKWSGCGLDKEKCDLSSWEAYRSLSLSSIKGKIKIPVDSILFINDFESKFIEKAISVSSNDKKIITEEKETEIKNNIWDGEALLDKSMFIDKFYDKHMLLLRNKFFKSCAFKTDIQGYFRDNNITEITQLTSCGGVTLAKEISQIKMITTPSSLKYLKFINGKLTNKNIENWQSKIGEEFGVVKYDKRTKYFNGRMVQSSYQLLNTLNFSEEETKELLKDNIDLLWKIKDDPAVLRYYFTDIIKREKDDVDIEEDGLVRRGEIIFRLLSINDGFLETKLFDTFKKATIKMIRDNIKMGHILLHGTNATLFGNGPELLKASIGNFDGKTHELNNNEIRCNNFRDKEELLCARSPHITMGNLYVVKNNLQGDIWKYFDLGDNIVCVNAIDENIQHKLNGCDYDSDTMLITNENLLIEKAKKYYKEFLVPVCEIKPDKENKKTDLVKLDIQTSNNRIGDIVNLSQILNSYLWNSINKGKSIKDLKDIYKDICVLAVLSGIEIDKAKRSFNLETDKAINDIRSKYKDYILDRPNFFNIIDKENNPKSKDKLNKRTYKYYLTTMDHINYLVGKLANFKIGKEKEKKFKPITSMFGNIRVGQQSNDYKRKENVYEIINNYKDQISKKYILLKNSDKEDVDGIYSEILDLRERKQKELKQLITNVNILKLVLKEEEKNNNGDWFIYSLLLNDDNPFVNELFESGKTKVEKLYESENGNITICQYHYDKK